MTLALTVAGDGSDPGCSRECSSSLGSCRQRRLASPASLLMVAWWRGGATAADFAREEPHVRGREINPLGFLILLKK